MKTINPFEIDAEIARHTGWRHVGEGGQRLDGRKLGVPPGVIWDGQRESMNWVPEFHRDLNAMAELERKLEGAQLETYLMHLLRATEEPLKFPLSLSAWAIRNILTATALERAEAYLKMIRKQP